MFDKSFYSLHTETMYQKGAAYVFILLGILLLIFLGGAYYFGLQKKSNNSDQVTSAFRILQERPATTSGTPVHSKKAIKEFFLANYKGNSYKLKWEGSDSEASNYYAPIKLVKYINNSSQPILVKDLDITLKWWKADGNFSIVNYQPGSNEININQPWTGTEGVDNYWINLESGEISHR